MVDEYTALSISHLTLLRFHQIVFPSIKAELQVTKKNNALMTEHKLGLLIA